MADDLEDDLPVDDDILDPEDDEEVLDPAGEPDDADEEEIDAAPEKPAKTERSSRGQGRIQRLAEERKRLSDENARLAREMEDLRRRVPVQQEDPRVEQERLALMSPEDRMQYQLDKALRVNQQQTQQALFNMQLQQDKTAYDAKAKENKVYRRFAEDVEREHQKLLAAGRHASREDILKYVVGQKALEQQGSGNPRARRSRERQEAPPVRGRGDVPRTSGKFDLNTPEGRAAAFEAKYGDRPISSF
jgi:hypothetical protein